MPRAMVLALNFRLRVLRASERKKKTPLRERLSFEGWRESTKKKAPYAKEPQQLPLPISSVEADAAAKKLSGKDSKDEWVRRSAAVALGKTREHGTAHDPAVVNLLPPKNWEVRIAAVEAFTKMGRLGVVQAPVVAKLLTGEKWEVRCHQS